MKLAHLQYYLGAALFARSRWHRRKRASFTTRTPSRPACSDQSRRSFPRPPPLPAAPAPPQKSASTEDNAPPAQSTAAIPPARPAEATAGAPTAGAPTATTRSALSGRGNSYQRRISDLVLAAQTALARLGYPVKADGKEGAATQQALREFEHAHGLPPATEINERLVRQLNQATRGGGH